MLERGGLQRYQRFHHALDQIVGLGDRGPNRFNRGRLCLQSLLGAALYLGGALLGGQLSADGREVIAQAVSASLTAPRNSNIALSFSSNRAATRASSCWIASRMAASA